MLLLKVAVLQARFGQEKELVATRKRFLKESPTRPARLAIGAAPQKKRLPKDEQNPSAGDAYWDDLILWLAYIRAGRSQRPDIDDLLAHLKVRDRAFGEFDGPRGAEDPAFKDRSSGHADPAFLVHG
jgi:hypothetical protein